MFVCLTTSGGVALKDAALFCFGVVVLVRIHYSSDK